MAAAVRLAANDVPALADFAAPVAVDDARELAASSDSETGSLSPPPVGTAVKLYDDEAPLSRNRLPVADVCKLSMMGDVFGACAAKGSTLPLTESSRQFVEEADVTFVSRTIIVNTKRLLRGLFYI